MMELFRITFFDRCHIVKFIFIFISLKQNMDLNDRKLFYLLRNSETQRCQIVKTNFFNKNPRTRANKICFNKFQNSKNFKLKMNDF